MPNVRCLIAALTAQAQYPAKPIRLIVPFAPGGPSDLLGRLVGQKLADARGQQVLIDNRTGANGIVGVEPAAKRIADGGVGSARLGAWMRPGSRL
jgi:tripartite-type tricarboxylate transporter receptor subunit TctC